MPRRSRRPSVITLVCSAIVILILGILLGGHPSWLPSPVRNAFVADTNESVINQALSIIQRDYYRKIDPNQLVNSSLAAAVASLHDPFSQYISPSSYTDFGNASPHVNGIGIDVQPDPRGLRVVDVFPGTPAAHAGLLPGDLIIKVGERALAGHSADYDSALIRGNAGSSVTLMVVRSGHPRSLTITRESFTVPVADDRLLTYHGIKLGYVQLTTFNQVGAGNEVRGDVDQLLDEGARGLILDLRDNGGGLITEAVNVASIFIPSGTVVSTAGRNSPRQVFTVTGDAISTKIPLVVLVDRGTASASEIVTAALQDHDRAVVVGTHTFGKGVFQEVQELPNGGALDITAGYYYTPDGRNLGGGGVKEGAGVTPNVYALDNPRTPQDEALTVAEKTVARGLQ